jgi:hypothetical protein
MLEWASRAIVQFKADTSDLERGLKKLTGLEKEHAQAQLDAAKQRNQGYDDWVKKLGNANQALELAGRAINVARDAFNSYADNLRLKAAAGNVSIERLKAASMGLRTEHELLSFAAQTQNGAFKLNQQQMETAQKAMVALTRAGFDQEEVTKKVTEALVKANGGGLDDFGIKVRSGKTDVENFNIVMEELAKKAAGVDSSTGTAAEGVQRMGVTMADAVDSMTNSLGDLVAALSPLLIGLAKGVELIAEIAKYGLGSVPGIGDLDALAKKRQDMIDRLLGKKPAEAPRQVVNAHDRWNEDGLGTVDEGTLLTASTRWQQEVAKRQAAAKAKRAATWEQSGASVTGTDTVGRPIGFGSTMYGAAADTNQYDEYGRALGLDVGSPLQANYDALTKGWQDKVAAQQEKKQTFLEGTFGKLEDFNLYATAFSTLTGGVTTAMDAWITGSVSAGQAVRKFLADSLKSLASQMAVEALKHGAYAIGSLAFGDVRGAGQHAAAAAAFGGAAAAAAVASKSLGGGGAPQSATASGGSAASTTGGSGGAGAPSGSSSRPVYVLVGDSFSEDSPRMRASRAQAAMERALRERDE